MTIPKNQEFFSAQDFHDNGSFTYSEAESVARFANALLRKHGTPIAGHIESEYGSCLFGSGQHASCEPTHTAILINIEPIERDSADKLLTDLANYTGHDTYLTELVDRAKKLRGGR